MSLALNANHLVGIMTSMTRTTRTDLGPDLTVDNELRPGDLGRIVEQHGRLYDIEYGLDRRFETYVAAGVADAASTAADPAPRFWIVRERGQFAGCVAMTTAEAGVGQFRWFLLEPHLRSRGLGAMLMNETMSHAADVGYERVFLWTFDALEAAAALYRRHGFVETERHSGEPWGVPVVEVRYERMC